MLRIIGLLARDEEFHSRGWGAVAPRLQVGLPTALVAEDQLGISSSSTDTSSATTREKK